MTVSRLAIWTFAAWALANAAAAADVRIEQRGGVLYVMEDNRVTSRSALGRSVSTTEPFSGTAYRDLIKLAADRYALPFTLNSVNAHAVAAEGFAQHLFLCASIVVEVPLRPAVVDPEAGRVPAGAGRRVAMANQRDVPTHDESFPGSLGSQRGQECQIFRS